MFAVIEWGSIRDSFSVGFSHSRVSISLFFSVVSGLSRESSPARSLRTKDMGIKWHEYPRFRQIFALRVFAGYVVMSYPRRDVADTSGANKIISISLLRRDPLRRESVDRFVQLIAFTAAWLAAIRTRDDFSSVRFFEIDRKYRQRVFHSKLSRVVYRS